MKKLFLIAAIAALYTTHATAMKQVTPRAPIMFIGQNIDEKDSPGGLGTVTGTLETVNGRNFSGSAYECGHINKKHKTNKYVPIVVWAKKTLYRGQQAMLAQTCDFTGDVPVIIWGEFVRNHRYCKCGDKIVPLYTVRVKAENPKQAATYILMEGYSLNQEASQEKPQAAQKLDINTILLLAAQKGDLDMVVGAIEEGADLECKTKKGNTALLLAAKAGHPEAVEYLLEQGANVNAKDRNGFDAVFLVAYRFSTMRYARGYNPTNDLATIGHLIKAGADFKKARKHCLKLQRLERK